MYIFTCIFLVHVQLLKGIRSTYKNEIVEGIAWFRVKCRQFQQIMKIHRYRFHGTNYETAWQFFHEPAQVKESKANLL